MKNKLKELDVDFIGGQQKPITKEEEQAISAFILSKKHKSRLKSNLKKNNKSSKKLHQTAE